jgi:hypothetical protein
MPLTRKGRKVLSCMRRQYGDKKGEGVFYATINTGKGRGWHRKRSKNKSYSSSTVAMARRMKNA